MHRRLFPVAAIMLVASLPQQAMTAPADAGPRAVSALKAKLAGDCRAVGGMKLVFRPGFERRADFNRDGEPDLLLDNRHLDCLGAAQASPFCGTGGCGIAVFVSVRSGYVKAFDGDAIEAMIVKAEGGDRLDLLLHGTQCGLSGMAECRRILRWTGKSLAP